MRRHFARRGLRSARVSRPTGLARWGLHAVSSDDMHEMQPLLASVLQNTAGFSNVPDHSTRCGQPFGCLEHMSACVHARSCVSLYEAFCVCVNASM